MRTQPDALIQNDINTSLKLYNAALIKVKLQKLYNNLYLKLLLPLTAISVSWFITDNKGEIRKNGVTNISNSQIDISNLPKGEYAIRIMGEVHNFELA